MNFSGGLWRHERLNRTSVEGHINLEKAIHQYRGEKTGKYDSVSSAAPCQYSWRQELKSYYYSTVMTRNRVRKLEAGINLRSKFVWFHRVDRRRLRSDKIHLSQPRTRSMWANKIYMTSLNLWFRHQHLQNKLSSDWVCVTSHTC